MSKKLQKLEKYLLYKRCYGVRAKTKHGTPPVDGLTKAQAAEIIRRVEAHDTLTKQRDDLSAACKRLLGAMACDELNNGQVFDDDLRKEVKEHAKAAIGGQG